MHAIFLVKLKQNLIYLQGPKKLLNPNFH